LSQIISTDFIACLVVATGPAQHERTDDGGASWQSSMQVTLTEVE
jgi:hypothetical protein